MFRSVMYTTSTGTACDCISGFAQMVSQRVIVIQGNFCSDSSVQSRLTEFSLPNVPSLHHISGDEN